MGWNIALEWCKQRLFTWQEKAELMHNLLAQDWYCATFSFPLFLGLLILLYVFSLSIYVEFIFLQVATPGRVLDHLKHTKGFSLGRLKYLVWFLHTHTHTHILNYWCYFLHHKKICMFIYLMKRYSEWFWWLRNLKLYISDLKIHSRKRGHTLYLDQQSRDHKTNKAFNFSTSIPIDVSSIGACRRGRIASPIYP